MAFANTMCVVCRYIIDSRRMQQLLAMQLPAAAQVVAGRPPYLCSNGAASDHLKGPLGAVLQLCAALQYGLAVQLNYNTVVPEDEMQQLSQQQADRLAGTGLLPALGAACSCTAAVLQKYSSTDGTGCTYAEEAAHVLLWLVLILGYAWPGSMFTEASALLAAMRPAVKLAATVLKVRRARLPSAAALLAAVHGSPAAGGPAECHEDSATAAGGTAGSTARQPMKPEEAGATAPQTSSNSGLLAGLRRDARYAAIKLASWMASIVRKEVKTDEPVAHPQARQLAASGDLLLLLVAVLGIVGHWLYKQQKGRSSVPPPEDACHMETSGGSGSGGSTGSRQQRRQQQRQLQEGLYVPPFYQSLLAVVGLIEADLQTEIHGSDLFCDEAQGAAGTLLEPVIAVCFQCHARLLQQHGMSAGGVYPPELYAPIMLLSMQLAAMPPVSLSAASTNWQLECSLQLMHMVHMDLNDDLPTGAAVPAAAAVQCFDGQPYRTKLLLQPLMQFVVPVVQHYLDKSAMHAASLPVTHPFVRQRLRVVQVATSLTFQLLSEGGCIGQRCIFQHCRSLKYYWLSRCHSSPAATFKSPQAYVVLHSWSA